MSVLANLNRVQDRIAASCNRVGRDPAGVKLLAITKGVPSEVIKEAIACGINLLGENRVQELLRKQDVLPGGPEWHYIGRLQTNKIKNIIGRISLLHSLDRWRLAVELDKAAREASTVVRALTQVNISGEKTRQGLGLSEVEDFLCEVSRLEGLEVLGLMTMAPWLANPEEARPVFRTMRELFSRLQSRVSGIHLKYLSMGMSSDYEVAVEEGANIVRIGSAIFSNYSAKEE